MQTDASHSITQEAVLGRLAPIIARHLSRNEDDIAPETYLEDLGASSLDLVEITLDAEQEFGVLLAGRPFFDSAVLVYGPGKLEQDGELTDAGRSLILQRFPHLRAEEAAAMDDIADVQRQVTRVSVWMAAIAALVNQIPERCRAAGGSVRTDADGFPRCEGADSGYSQPSLEEWNHDWLKRAHRENEA